MALTFRDLRADEIDVRVGTVKEGKGVSLLLYKDARCDQIILDETVGAMNWQRKHSRDNANCTVEIWDEEKKQWVGKEDTGTESKTEAEKGLASDSFKRACFNWGIGRELYTAPFIWVSIPGVTKESARYLKFWVKSMTVDNKKITGLVVGACDDYGNKTDDVVFGYPRGNKDTNPQTKPNTPQPGTTEKKATARQIELLLKYYTGANLAKLLNANNIERIEDLPMKKASELISKLNERKEKAS